MKTKWMTLIAICCMAIACSSNEEPIVEPKVEKEEAVDPKKEEPKKEEPKAEQTVTDLKTVELTEAEKALAAQHLDFAFRFIQKVDATLPDTGQRIVSPLSATFALSMLTNGATGETLSEMIDALGFGENGIAEINAFSKKMMEELPARDPATQVGIANSLWTNTGFTPLDAYIKALDENFDAEVREYDFKQGPAPINAWCAEKTNNCIPNFLQELNPDMRMFLANALYFKSVWSNPFDKESTRDGSFTNEDGTTSDVQLMQDERRSKYAHTKDFDIAQLNYGNAAFCLQVILPAEGMTADKCLEGLDGETWLAAQKVMEFKTVDFQLPKFETQSKDGIVDALKAMGMQKCFSDKEAQFDNLSEEPLYVNAVQQAIYFRLDEEGTEAAAVTGTGMDTLVGETSAPVTFHVNRPFLFILKDNSTNNILFIGKMEKM